MADLLALPRLLQAAGLDVTTLPGWETRSAPGAFDPIGVLIHHTASRAGSGDLPSLRVVRDGRPDVPGPLCQVLVGRSGKVLLVAAGRANHAGTGGPLGPVLANNGNRALVGIEAENDGVGELWPSVQLVALARTAAVVLTHLGQPAARCWGHKEWAPGRKIDPSFPMPPFRAQVAHIMEELTMPTANPYAAEVNEALALLAEHAGYTGKLDGWFGPGALAALHRLKNFWVADAELAIQLRGELAEAQAEVARLTGLDTVARQAPAVLGVIQAMRSAHNAAEAELGRIVGQP